MKGDTEGSRLEISDSPVDTNLWCMVMLSIVLAHVGGEMVVSLPSQGAVVAKWSGHRPGNYKVPGSMQINLWLLLCFLGQETYPSRSYPAVKPGHNNYCDLCVTGHS